MPGMQGVSNEENADRTLRACPEIQVRAKLASPLGQLDGLCQGTTLPSRHWFEPLRSPNQEFRDGLLRIHAGLCLGIVNTVIVLHGGKIICPPAKVSSEQTIVMMVKYMEDNPDKLNYPLSVLAENYFTNTWTCKN